MIGLAGIGYGLLRLVAPHRVPSILLLASSGESGDGKAPLLNEQGTMSRTVS